MKRPANAICSIDGCERKLYGWGWCNKHYQRWRTHGDPNYVHVAPIMSLEERFWSKVDKKNLDGCWEWTASKSNGYGHLNYANKTTKYKGRIAHRISWELQNGPIPEGLWVLHRCDNPSCVNPAHLFLGTHNDNMADMVAKGRSVGKKGENHRSAKLTEVEVIRIRSDPRVHRKIAEDYEVGKTQIQRIKAKIDWRHLS